MPHKPPTDAVTCSVCGYSQASGFILVYFDQTGSVWSPVFTIPQHQAGCAHADGAHTFQFRVSKCLDLNDFFKLFVNLPTAHTWYIHREQCRTVLDPTDNMSDYKHNRTVFMSLLSMQKRSLWYDWNCDDEELAFVPFMNLIFSKHN